MTRTALTTALAALLASACASQPPAPPAAPPVPAAATPAAPTAEQIAAETARLNAWFEARYEEELAFSPIMLTFLGRKDRYNELDDMSEQAEIDQLQWRRNSVEAMKSQFRYDWLTDEAKTSYDIWQYQYERQAAGAAFRRNRYMFDHMNGAQSDLPTLLISFHRVDTESDLQAYIDRVAAIPTAMDTLIGRARLGLEQGVRPPRFAYEGVIDQARKVITGAPFTKGKDSALWADLQAEIDGLQKKKLISAARAQALKSQARTTLVMQLKPAYQRLIAFVESDIGNAAVNPSGVGSTQANGAAYYDEMLRLMTTTDLSAEQIHQIGLSEVARLRGEMIALKDRVGFNGDLEAFFAFIDSDKRFVFPENDAGRQAYLDQATAAINNIKKELPRYFGVLPKADLVVKRVEAFREQPGAAQHYYPGTPDGSRPGTYYVHLSDVSAMPKTELEVIAYHEGLPGHHMQISIAQELTGVPTFRTQADFTAYQEGWALYSEWLAKEMPNTYQDPYSEYGRLSSEMWRAVRLVVDTGLHAKGWTEQQAVDYFDANLSVPRAAVVSEVQRYIAAPGQATAYKIGMMRIQQLRRSAEAALGDLFDIRRFHDCVLAGGALPLDLLDRRVKQWIAAEQQR